MTKRVQLRRGNTTQHAAFAGALGEVTVDTDKKVAVVHDGSTLGGFPLARNDVIDALVGNIKRFGVVGDGVTDETSTLTTGLQAGGLIYIPEGTYLIAAAGPDSGGVEVTITKSTAVYCHPNAKFVAGSGLDNDMIRFIVPSNGAGLPADGVVFSWHGGIFDQRLQKNSTSVPFSAEFPPVNVGSSATCDGLSIRGDWLNGSTPTHGIISAEVSSVTFNAGTHWQIAGGDGALFIGGCRSQVTHHCTFIGARDLGGYYSGDATNGTLRCKTVAYNNTAINCFGGLSVKRSSCDFDFYSNTIINSPRAFAVEHLIGGGQKRGSIRSNTMVNCSNIARVTYATGVDVKDNNLTSAGAFLADGTSAVGDTSTNNVGFYGVNLRGCTDCTVDNNKIIGVNAIYQTAYVLTGYMLLLESYDPGTGAVNCTKNLLQNNYSDGMRRGGTDHAGADQNRFLNNLADNAAVTSSVVLAGTNSLEVRCTPGTMAPSYSHPLQFADGSAAAPIIARRAGATTGMYFAANTVGLAAAGLARVTATNLGVGFNGATPAARPTYGAPTGTATRSTFDTTTITLPQLAERVKALIDDLRTYGLAG